MERKYSLKYFYIIVLYNSKYNSNEITFILFRPKYFINLLRPALQLPLMSIKKTPPPKTKQKVCALMAESIMR